MWLILGPPYIESGLFAAMRQAFFYRVLPDLRMPCYMADYIEMVNFVNTADIIPKCIAEKI